ncbi:nicotinamide riboside transporter PnuC [Bacteroidota bacterium]
MESLLEGIQANINNMTTLEAFGVLFGLLSVWFAKKENILVFPSGIISVLIYVYLCYQTKLYADMGINAYYFVMSVYGWYVWSRKVDNQHQTPITTANRSEWLICLVTFLLSFLILYFSLISFTDSDIPFWDSLTTALFFVGMWFMAKKKIENWIIWIIADAISVPLYYYKDLQLTSIQYFIFLLIAIAGYISWKKTLELQTG